MEETLQTLKETLTIIILFYKNIKSMGGSSDCNTDFFAIVIGVLQEDTFAPDMFIICIDYECQLI